MVRENLAALLESLRAISREPKWVRPENLHVTLKFLGEVPETKVDSIRTALARIRSEQPVSLEFRGLGFFQMQNIHEFFGRESKPRQT